jgi:hypothetical protein
VNLAQTSAKQSRVLLDVERARTAELRSEPSFFKVKAEKARDAAAARACHRYWATRSANSCGQAVGECGTEFRNLRTVTAGMRSDNFILAQQRSADCLAQVGDWSRDSHVSHASDDVGNNLGGNSCNRDCTCVSESFSSLRDWR